VGDNGLPKADSLTVKFVDDLIKQRDNALAEGQGFDTGEALQRALALQNKGFESALTSVTANIGKGDTSAVATLTTLVTELIKANTTRKEDPILQTLLERALQKPEDPFEKITMMLTLLKELGVKIGPGRVAEGGGSEWAGVVEKLVDKAPELLANAARLVPPRGPVPVAPRPVLVPPAAPIAPVGSGFAAPQAHPGTGTVPNPPPANLPPESDTPEVSPELADRIAQNVVKAAIMRMLFAGDSGDDAAHYAEMAHEPLARTLAHLLKTDPMQLKEDPILGQALTHVNVMAFAKEFVDYFEEEEGSPAIPLGPITSPPPA